MTNDWYEKTHKTQQFNLRLSKNDKDKITELSKKFNLSKSDFIRYAIHSLDKRETIEVDVSPLRTMAYELRKQGTNLNQMMYYLNSHSRTCTKDDLESIRNTLKHQEQTLDQVESVYNVYTKKEQLNEAILLNKHLDIKDAYTKSDTLDV